MEDSGPRRFHVPGSRLEPGCAELGIADGIADPVGQYVAQGASPGSGR